MSWMKKMFFNLCFLSSPEDMLIDFREREREEENMMPERNIDQFPATLCPDQDQTCKVGMCPEGNQIRDP